MELYRNAEHFQILISMHTHIYMYEQEYWNVDYHGFLCISIHFMLQTEFQTRQEFIIDFPCLQAY